MLNFEVTKADAIPTLGRAVEWETIHDEDGIVIEVASKEAMLVMKLRANRPGRDTRDIEANSMSSSTPAICSRHVRRKS